jgi:hypothetical protein
MIPSNKFYFGSLSAGGSAVILIEMLVKRNRKNKFVEPCHLDLLEYGGDYCPYPPYRVPYVLKIEKDLQVRFRSVNWLSNIDYLKSTIMENQPNSIWFSTYDPNISLGLKEVFGNLITTISVIYTPQDYDFLLQKWARWQAGLLLSNSITVQKQFESVTQAVDYCLSVGSEYFGYSILKEKTDSADIMIPIRDLFQKNKFEEILNSLDCQNNQEDWDFYAQYLKYCG